MGIRSFAHLLIAHLLIHSKLIILMSDCERFAQIAQDKWGTVSKSLRTLMTKERPWAIRSGCSWSKSKWANRSFIWSKSLIRSQETSDWLKKNWIKLYLYIRFLKAFLEVKKIPSNLRISLIFFQKKSVSLSKPISQFPTLNFRQFLDTASHCNKKFPIFWKRKVYTMRILRKKCLTLRCLRYSRVWFFKT